MGSYVDFASKRETPNWLGVQLGVQRITPELKQRIDAVNRAKDEAAYSVINLGKRLVELKGECQHGQFTALAESQCGLKERECRNLMRIYQEFGQSLQR